MNKIILRIKCCLLTSHKMKKYQTKMVNGVYGKVEAQRTRCVNCFYIEKFWVAKEKLRSPVRCN